MGKNIKYGEFTFNKPNPRPTVKGYAFGGEAMPANATQSLAPPLAAKKPTLAPKPLPTLAPKPASTLSPTKPIVGGMTIDQLKYAKKNNQAINPNDYAAMARATENAKIRQQAMDARARAEAEANRLPSKNSRTAQLLMDRSSTINSPRDAMEFGKPITRAKGGDVHGYGLSSIADKLSKTKAEMAKLSSDAKKNTAQSRSKYRNEQMNQGKANLLPSPAKAPPAPVFQTAPTPMQKGGKAVNTSRMNRLEELGRVDSEKAYTNKGNKNLMAEKSRLVGELSSRRMKNGEDVKGYAFGGPSFAKAKPPASATKPAAGQIPAYAQNFANQATQTPTSLSGLKLPSAPPMMPPNANQMGALSNLMRQYSQQKPMQQPMGNIPNFAQPYINQANQPIGYPPPPPTQQPMGGIPNYAQPYVNQSSQSPVNTPTQAGMPPQIAGMGLGMGIGFKKGGDVSKGKAKAMESSSKDKAQDKAMIKKAMKQHDQQEHKGGKGTVLKLKNGGKPPVKAVKLVGMKREPLAMVKKEVSLLKKAGAPAKMIKEEMVEAIPAMACGGGMRKGGVPMKKGVPTFNRTPKC